jgi:hypothetical protein
VAGFLLMLVAALVALSARGAGRSRPGAARRTPRLRRRQDAGARRSLLARLEERWQRRQDDR